MPVARLTLLGQEALVSAHRTWVNMEGSSRYPSLARPVNSKSETKIKTPWVSDGPNYYSYVFALPRPFARQDVFEKATVISSLETYVEGWGGVLRAT